MPATNELLQEGRYRINNEFPAGEEGSAFDAYDNVSKTNVIVKEISLRINKSSPGLERVDPNMFFVNQVKILSEIKHPSLLGIRDHFSEAGRQYLVMEAADGDDFQTLLDRQKSCFPVSDATSWADQLLDGLKFLHTYKTRIIHKNIRPSNIKLGSDGKVKLMLSDVAAGGSPNSASAGSSIAYAPLEQIWSGLDAASQKVIIAKYDEQSERILKGDLDPRSDVYSLGATLYHLVTARLPTDALERSIEILDGRPDPLRAPHEMDPAIPPEISEVLMKALEIKREYRFDSPSIMRQVLKTAVVRVKEREAEELLEQEEAANDIKLAAQKKLEAASDHHSETLRMKKMLEEAEAQRLLAEQRAAEAEKKLLESEALRQSGAEMQAAVASTAQDDVFGVLDPGLHVSGSPGPSAASTRTTPLESRTEVSEVPPESPGSGSFSPSVPSRTAAEAEAFEGQGQIEFTNERSGSGSSENADADTGTFVVSDREEADDEVNFLTAAPGGSRLSIPAVAAGAAVIIMIAIGAWMFFSSGKPAPVKATTTEVPAASQPSQPEPAVSSAFQPESAPVDDQITPVETDPTPTENVIAEPSTAKTAPPRARKTTPAKPSAKKVTADDLINDN